ncbi:MAG: lauroyl acyltransferase [Pseudomonadota bacterium]
MSNVRFVSKHWIENALFRSVIAALKLLPYDRRLNAMSWTTRRLIGPLVNYKRRALRNLSMIYPDWSDARRHDVADQVLDTLARTIIENYSPDDFRARIANHDIEGPGLAAALKAKDEGKAILFSSGHWSNHEATRTALDLKGFKVGGIYNPMKNPYFNEHYVESIAHVSGPIFPRGKEGLRGFLDFLRDGGHGFLLHDVYFKRGEWMNFLGKPARTAFSAADLALKYDALLIPYFNTRQPDGVSFKIELCEPIPHTTPREMTRKLMDLLEEKIERDPGQWLWIHKRWKGQEEV